MVNYTYEESNKHIYPNIRVDARFRDGVQVGWRVIPEDEYVLSQSMIELDPETEEEITVTDYHEVMFLPYEYDWKNFALVAVPASEAEESTADEEV